MKEKKLKHILIVHKNKDDQPQNPDNLWIEPLLLSLMKTTRAKVTTVTNDDDMEDVLQNETVDTILFVTGNSLLDARNVSGLFKGKIVILSIDKMPENSVVFVSKRLKNENDAETYLKIILN